MVIVILLICGLVLGSFVNALVWRIHEQSALLEKEKLTQADKVRLRRLSISKGRSMCLHCGHELATKDLIPVISWLWLRGKCRYCGARIPDTPLAELLVPALFVISWLWWPYVFAGWAEWAAFILWLACLVGFVALILYDARWYLLPDRIVFPLAVLALGFRVLVSVAASSEWLTVLLGGLWGLVVLAGLFYVLFVVSNERWIGGGDVKLAVVLGLLAGGPLASLVLLFVASLSGTVAAVPLALQGKAIRQARIPFGPFLVAATVVAVLFAGSIVDWYTSWLMHV